MTGPAPESSSGTGDTTFRSAEEWLAAQGIRREPIRVAPEPDPEGAPALEPSFVAAPDSTLTGSPAPVGGGPAPSVRELAQLATEPPPAVPGEGVDPRGHAQGDPDEVPRERGELGDEVSRALAFIRRSTSSTPTSQGRLERKLRDREVPAPAIRLAMADARDQGLVDDPALAAALVAEGRANGHAPVRLRADLKKREFAREVIETALGQIGDRDPEAVAFDVAHRKASSYGDVDAETAFRRLVGFLARKGHNEHIARKVARQVVFDAREPDRVTGH